MRTTTPAFQAAIVESHQAVSRVEILDSGEAVAEFDITSGTVTLDANAAIRGRCDLTFVDDGTLGITPTSPADALSPYGNELRVSRGIQFPDGTTELVTLGVFGIQSVDINDSDQGLVVATAGLDRAQKVADARFEEPYQIAAGTDYLTALEDVIAAGVSGLTYNLSGIVATTPALVAQEGDDRWAFAQEMARAIGQLIYFNGDGEVVLEPISPPSGTADLALVEGDSGVLVAAGRRWTREGTFNRVIATGENTGETAPARGVATDDNPQSPTYYYGPFGKVPRFYSSPFITTDAQADSAAQGILSKELGTSETVNFGAVVNPALEPNDVVQITRARAGIDESHVVDSLTIPLAFDQAMTGQTRAVQIT